MVKRGYADTPEGQVHYLTAGEGEPLMLLHQGPRSARMFLKLIPLLAKEYRVIAMDMLGSGNSDSPPPVIDIQYLARNVVHVLDALQIDKFHIFGIHTGARVSGEVAAGFPDRVGTLVLMSYTFMEKVDHDRYTETHSRGGGRPRESASDGLHLLGIWASARRSALKWLVHAVKPPFQSSTGWSQTSPDSFITQDHLEFMDRYFLDSMQSKGRFNQVHDQGLESYDSRARLPLIEAPTLHINADSPYESVFSRRGQTLAKIIPNCEVATLSPSDDNAPEFNPEGLAKIMLNALRKHPLKEKANVKASKM